MRYLLLFVFMFFLSVVQTTVLGAIEIFGVIPNLLLTAVICYAIIRGDFEGVIFGAVIGIFLDFLSGRMVGMNLILCTLVSFSCCSLYDALFNNNPFVASVFVLLVSIVYEFLIYVFYFLFWGDANVWFALIHKILPGAVYNALSAFLIYPVLKKICLFGAGRWEND